MKKIRFLSPGSSLEVDITCLTAHPSHMLFLEFNASFCLKHPLSVPDSSCLCWRRERTGIDLQHLLWSQDLEALPVSHAPKKCFGNTSFQ